MRKVRAASLADVSPGQPKLVELEGRQVVLVRIAEHVYCLDNTCAHKGGPLSEGKLTGSRLACPWHGWMYDVRTGQCVFPGRGAGVAPYATRMDGGDIVVEIP